MTNLTPRVPLKTLFHPSCLLALGFGSGLFPVAPGTAGTLVGLLIGLLAIKLPLWVLWGGVIVSFVLGIWICNKAGQLLKQSDHPAIVWDEIVAFWLIMLLIPNKIIWLAVAFLLFRLFDITKLWPANWVEKKLRGGIAVMLDDIIAAIYTIISIQIIIKIIHLISEF